ncbi:MAG: SciE type virulence protein [Planctomycetota bacterium]|nr:MAG: SciE type virulence protein [Planctomycetota bacterium]
MESTATAVQHFQAGRLQDAVSAALADVKKNPSDTERRGLLAELLCLAADWERADKQIDTIGHQDPQAIVGLSLIRQLIRAEVARKECFVDGRPPELLGEPTPWMRTSLEALVAIREGDATGAAALLAEAEGRRPTVAGTCDGQPFTGFRDLDDVTAGVFEVLTSTGKYFWIPIERVESVVFQPPKRPRDLIWRQAEMTVSDGPYGDVYVPAVYFGPPDQTDDQLKLGRGTDWSGGDGSPVRGRGQRMYLVGEEATPIMQLTSLEFA